MKKKNCIVFSQAIIEAQKSGKCSLKELEWNFDLTCSNSTAKEFLKNLNDCENCSLQKITLNGVFQLKENRDEMREMFGGKNIQIHLFAPEYTDDESEDHDNSEDESQDDGEDSACDDQKTN